MAHYDTPIDTPPRAPSPIHRFGTLAVHAGSPHDAVTGAVIESVSAANSDKHRDAALISSDFLINNVRTDRCRQARRRV